MLKLNNSSHVCRYCGKTIDLTQETYCKDCLDKEIKDTLGERHEWCVPTGFDENKQSMIAQMEEKEWEFFVMNNKEGDIIISSPKAIQLDYWPGDQESHSANLMLDRAVKELNISECMEDTYELSSEDVVVTREQKIKMMLDKGFVWNSEINPERDDDYDSSDDVDYQNAIK